MNWTNVFQRIDGFGASCAFDDYNFPTAWTQERANMFFGTNSGTGVSFDGKVTYPYVGCGYSLLRSSIGAAGSTRATDTPGSQPGVMQMAQALGARVWSVPWSPAGGFKSNGDPNTGGNYLGNGNNITNLNYASQLANFVVNMKNSYGVNIYAVSVQNEPDTSTKYASCTWNGQQIHDFVTNLYAAFASKGVSNTKIMIPEDNSWYSPNNYQPTLSDPNSAADVSIIAEHYYNQPQPITPIPVPGLPTWETEHYLGGGWDPSIGGALNLAMEIHNFMALGNASAYHFWEFFDRGDQNDNQGLTDPNGVPGKKIYAIGQFSRFVRPNYYRIYSINNGAALITAYKDSVSSNHFAIVAINYGSANVAQTFRFNDATIAGVVTPWITSATMSLSNQPPVNVIGGLFNYTLPGNSMVSFAGQISFGGNYGTWTTLTPSANPSVSGQAVIYTATVQTNQVTATGTTSNMVFSLDGTPVYTNAVSNGQATYTNSTLSIGSHTILASYLGDAKYLSSSNTLLQVVGRYYTNNAAGNWTAAGNWVGGSVPQAGGSSADVIMFNPGSADASTADLAGNYALNMMGLLAHQTVTVNSSASQSLSFANSATLASVNGGSLNINMPMTVASSLSVLVTNSGSININSIISGSGSLAVAGGGTLTLTGNNTYTGGNTISSGTLKLQSGAFSTTASSYSIASGAVLNLDGATSVPSGTATICGGGTLRITGGTLNNGIGGGCNIAIAMNAGGLIDVQAGAGIVNGGWNSLSWDYNLASLNINGTFDVWNGNDVTMDALTGSGTVSNGYSSGTVTFYIGVNNGSGTFSGSINSTGNNAINLNKNGSGTETLSGINNDKGTITVSGGALLINGNSSAMNNTVTVSAGSYFGSTGSGASIGGKVTYQSGALALFTNAATPFAFNNSLILNGNVVHLQLSNNVPAGTYTLATYNANGSSGSFSSTPVVDSGSLAANQAAITTSGGNVRLTVASSSILPRTGWVASASSTSAYGNDNITNAFDGNLTTRWSTGSDQANGQWFQVDMLSAQTFNKIVLDAGSSAGDYPRGYQVNVSNDGANWGSPVAIGTGSAVTTITFSTQTARYIRVTQTGSASGTWWSIAEFNVYSPAYTLTETSPNGTVTFNPPGPTYPAGTVVTVKVVPDAGYVFNGWSGDLSGSANPMTITMTTNKSITANTIANNALTLTGVTMSPDGSLSFSITNAGGVYRVQTSTNLGDPGGWTSISTNTAPFTFTDTNVPGGMQQRFYRVVTP